MSDIKILFEEKLMQEVLVKKLDLLASDGVAFSPLGSVLCVSSHALDLADSLRMEEARKDLAKFLNQGFDYAAVNGYGDSKFNSYYDTAICHSDKGVLTVAIGVDGEFTYQFLTLMKLDTIRKFTEVLESEAGAELIASYLEGSYGRHH